MKYTLKDTHNDKTISTHRSLVAAVKAEQKFDRAVKRANGASSYIPTSILDGDGNRVDIDEVWQARHNAGLI